MFGTKFCLSVAGTVMMLAAGSAQASEKPVAIATTAATSAAAAGAVNLNQRYCIVNDVTGSRIQRKECAPLGQWKDRGIDPTQMRRR